MLTLQLPLAPPTSRANKGPPQISLRDGFGLLPEILASEFWHIVAEGKP